MEQIRICLTALNGAVILAVSIYAFYIAWKMRYCKNYLAIAILGFLQILSLYFLVTSFSALNYAMGLNSNIFSAVSDSIFSQASVSFTTFRIVVSFLLLKAIYKVYDAIRKAEREE